MSNIIHCLHYLHQTVSIIKITENTRIKLKHNYLHKI